MFTFTMMCVCVCEFYVSVITFRISENASIFNFEGVFLLVSRDPIPDWLELFDFVVIQI